MYHNDMPQASFSETSKKVIRIHRSMAEALGRKRTPADVAMGLLAIGHGRRKVVAWVTSRVADFDGQIVWHDGTPFVLGENEIEEAFNLDDDNELDDEMATRRDRESMRWLSGLMKFLEKEPKQRPQEKVKKRLLLLTIALMNEVTWGKVRWPKILDNRTLGFTYRKRILEGGIEEAYIKIPAPNSAWRSVPCRRCVVGHSPAEQKRSEERLRKFEERSRQFIDETLAWIDGLSEEEKDELFFPPRLRTEDKYPTL